MTVIDKKFVAPPLVTATTEYDVRREDQLIYQLRLYFNLLDNYLAAINTLLNNGGQFDTLSANHFQGGTFSGEGITGSYINGYAIGAHAMLAEGLINKSFVGTQIMGNNFYGGTYYGDGRFLQLPYNQIISTSNQTALALDQAYPITYTSTDYPDGISIVSNSRITFAKQGIYLLTYSIQFENTTNDRQTIDIWLSYKGTNIPNSNSAFGIPQRKSSGNPSQLIAVTPIMVDITADGDYVELLWHPSDLGVGIKTIPGVSYSVGVTPTIPDSPSVILTVQHISHQFPPVQRIAPAPVFGFGEVGNVVVSTNRT